MSDEKKKNGTEENGDQFWSRILIFTVIIVWSALMMGNWIGHYMIKAGIFSRKSSSEGGEFKMMSASKPKPWKKPVRVSTPEKPPAEDIDSPKTPQPDLTGEPGAQVKPSMKPEEKPRPEPSPSRLLEIKPEPKPSPSPRVEPRPSPPPKPVQKPSPKPAPKETESHDGDSGEFSLQCGSFERNDYALELVDKLKAKGFSPTISKVGNSYKVYVGNYNDRKKAQDVQADLKTNGYEAFIVGQ